MISIVEHFANAGSVGSALREINIGQNDLHDFLKGELGAVVLFPESHISSLFEGLLVDREMEFPLCMKRTFSCLDLRKRADCSKQRTPPFVEGLSKLHYTTLLLRKQAIYNCLNIPAVSLSFEVFHECADKFSGICFR